MGVGITVSLSFAGYKMFLSSVAHEFQDFMSCDFFSISFVVAFLSATLETGLVSC